MTALLSRFLLGNESKISKLLQKARQLTRCRSSQCSMDAFGARVKIKKKDNEYIVIRSDSETSNLISAFGVGVKETRLTSFLGYLISLNITELCNYFEIKSPILTITIEKKLTTQRCDIVIETIENCIIIEAKKTMLIQLNN